MMIQDNSYYWKKKTIVSYWLSVLVFWIHISSFANYTFDHSNCADIYAFLDTFLCKIITPFAVPLFFILSGATFFRNYSAERAREKIKSRFSSLVVPYFVWNILFTLFAILTSYTFISNYFIGREKFVITPMNLFLAVFLYRQGPFWFIFDLIIYILLSPVIHALLKNKWLGLVTISVVSIIDFWGYGLPRYVFFSSESIIYYLIGCYVGIHCFGVFSQKAGKIQILLGTAGGILGLIYEGLRAYGCIKGNTAVDTAMLTLISFSMWICSDMIIPQIRERNFMKHSFIVYAMHINVSAVITKLLYLAFPKNIVFAFPNFLLTTILTLILIEVFCIVTEKYFKKVWKVLSGNR